MDVGSCTYLQKLLNFPFALVTAFQVQEHIYCKVHSITESYGYIQMFVTNMAIFMGYYT